MLPRVSAEFGLSHSNVSGLDVVHRAFVAIAALYSAQNMLILPESKEVSCKTRAVMPVL